MFIVKNTNNLYLLSSKLVNNIIYILRNYMYFGYTHAAGFNANKISNRYICFVCVFMLKKTLTTQISYLNHHVAVCTSQR